MSTTEFAMVNELASLVEDNLPCKHLLLSMEAAFINLLQDDKCSGGLLELEPMNSYNRLLLHRLADIFGFAHESVGEGDDRHLVLERRPETSIPSILLSDILDHCDDHQSVVSSQHLLKREECPSELMMKSLSDENTLDRREPADLSSAKRFSLMHVENLKQRPRCSPLVASRMIAHALGKSVRDCKLHEVQCTSPRLQAGNDVGLCSRSQSNQNEIISIDRQTLNIDEKGTQPQNQAENQDSRGTDVSSSEKMLHRDKKGNFKEEQMGAARRMFAHAMRLRTN